MKKIIILLIALLSLTGCYDNIELSDLAIISGMGIDYIDKEYQVTYEILNDNKTNDATNKLSYTVTGHGKSISDAFVNANYSVSKKPFFAHLKILIISENITGDKFKDIVDYIFRDNSIRDEFQLLISEYNKPKEILNNNSEEHPVVSDYILSLINTEKYNNNLATNEPFHKIIAKIVSNDYDILINSLSIKDNTISLGDSYIFNGYNYKNTLSKEYSSIYNLLQKKSYSTFVSKKYKNSYLAISITNNNSSIELKDDKIIINLSLNAKIVENDENLDLRKEKTYSKFNSIFKEEIENEITNLIKYLQENNSDILGFKNIYYKKYNKNNNDLWRTADILINLSLKVDNKGAIYEVN